MKRDTGLQDKPCAHAEVYHPYSGHPHTHAHPCICKDPDTFMPLPSYLQLLSPWRIYLGPGLVLYFSALTAHTPPSSPKPPTPPPPAPPLRKYSSGVPRAAQEMLCTLRVSQAIFCPRTGERSGQEQPVSCGFSSASTICSQYFSVSQCLILALYFFFSPQGLFDPMPFATFHSLIACLPILQNSAQCHLFRKLSLTPPIQSGHPSPLFPELRARCSQSIVLCGLVMSLPPGWTVRDLSAGSLS